MKRTRYKYQAANQLGTLLTKSGSYSLTESNILQDGYQFVKLNGKNARITLPSANDNLKGIVIRVTNGAILGSVYVAAGFGGGGASFDTVELTAYGTVDFWCDGSYWYAMSESIVSVGSSSSSSSSSSS